MTRPGAHVLVLTMLLAVLASLPVLGQFRQGRGRVTVSLATPESFDGGWQFCRLAYRGRAWATDYPDADYNFSIRLSELTKTAVSRAANGDPKPLIVRPIDDAIFKPQHNIQVAEANVRINAGHAVAAPRERHAKIGSRGGFTHAALAGGDCYDGGRH